MRRTKIVATLGPRSRDIETLRQLMLAGVDVFRLNFSHGTHEERREDVANVRRLAEELDRPVAILQDLQGPKIRTGPLEGGEPVFLDEALTLVITTRPVTGTAGLVSTTYQNLPDDVRVGDRILLSDGLIELRVMAKHDRDVECRVVHGGVLKEHQGINLPGVPLSTAALTEKDRQDLELGLTLGVDYVALSFVRSPDDVEELRGLIRASGADVPIISKIEKPEAVDRLEEIIRVSDGLMVARGDLGVEMSPEQVPIIQKQIILLAIRYGRPVITATQMLESMIVHPRPTRAEASDVANAILDGTDAVMLSGETAVGMYPVEAVRVMDRIARETERRIFDGSIIESKRWTDIRHEYVFEDVPARRLGALADASLTMADETSAAAIVPFTMSGRTGLAISQRRPRAPIYMLTPDARLRVRASLWWGVQCFLIPMFEDTDEMMEKGEQVLTARELIRVGETIVCIAGSSTNTPGGTNVLKLHTFDGRNPYASGAT